MEGFNNRSNKTEKLIGKLQNKSDVQNKALKDKRTENRKTNIQ